MSAASSTSHRVVFDWYGSVSLYTRLGSMPIYIVPVAGSMHRPSMSAS